MKDEKDKLIEELTNVFFNLKKIKLQAVTSCEDITHSEKMILCILKEISKDGIAKLSELRDKIKLAPSTITPIITLLEDKGLIERCFDKNDRRNICMKITLEAEKLACKIKSETKEELSKYIEYMGDIETKELIRLITKTSDFFNRKEEK